MTPEEQKKADEQKAAQEAAAKTAASAVLDAKRTTVTAFVGRVGGPFVVHGTNFGAGKVTIAGREVHVTSRSDSRIKGQVPRDLKSGPVDVAVGGVTLKAKLQ